MLNRYMLIILTVMNSTITNTGGPASTLPSQAFPEQPSMQLPPEKESSYYGQVAEDQGSMTDQQH